MTPVQWLLNELKLEIHQLEEVLPLFQQALDMEVKQSQSDIMLGRSSIEISDEEIEKAASEYADKQEENGRSMDSYYDTFDDFVFACKWYREQLKQKNESNI